MLKLDPGGCVAQLLTLPPTHVHPHKHQNRYIYTYTLNLTLALSPPKPKSSPTLYKQPAIISTYLLLMAEAWRP
jgi:hypothetical protein